MPDRSAFAIRFEHLIEDTDIDPKKLAAAMQLKDTSTFSRYKSGEREPSLMRLAALCRYVNLSADFMIGIADQPRPLTATEPLPMPESTPERPRCPICGTRLRIEVTKDAG